VITLMSLGPIVFDLVTNLDGTEGETVSSFARHEVFGTSPVYEVTGDEESTMTLSGVIHPEHFGGLASLSAIEAARAAKVPLPLMRGDYVPLGWFLIDRFSQQSDWLNHRGVGREIRFDVELIRVGTPSRGFAPSILRLFQ